MAYDMVRVGVLIAAIALVLAVPLYVMFIPTPIETDEIFYPYNPKFSDYYSGYIMEDNSCFPANYLIPNSSFFLKDYVYLLLDMDVTVTENGLRFDYSELRSPQGLIVEKFFICQFFGENLTDEEIVSNQNQVIFPNISNPIYFDMQFGELDNTYPDELVPISSSINPSLTEIYSMNLSDMDSLSWGDITIEKSYELLFYDWNKSCPCKFRIWINNFANATYNFDFGQYSVINATFGSILEVEGSSLTINSDELYDTLEVWFT